ncbi:MAG: hypothetical protein ACE5PV_13980 [Candidatus Poribacteria bacterium]
MTQTFVEEVKTGGTPSAKITRQIHENRWPLEPLLRRMVNGDAVFTDLTGEEWFLEHARAMYAQTIRERSVNAINNCYWDTPTLLYYLKQFGLGKENANETRAFYHHCVEKFFLLPETFLC